MRGARRLTTVESSRDDNALARAVPCDSPLHRLTGFERISSSKLYPRGAVLFVEGQTVRGVHVLCTGRAKVSISSADGRKVIMRIARAGDVLGLDAALTGHAHEATAEMLEPGRIDFVSRQDFLSLLERQKGFGLNLVRALSKELSECVEHARLLLLSGSAVEKLAGLILKWSRDFGERTTGGTRLQILLTQEEIAQIIGASRETVTRVFSTLKQKQIIRVNAGAMVIRNNAALALLVQRSP